MTGGQQVSSALFSWNLHYQRYQYVDGDFPKGIKFRVSLSDHDLEKIRKKGGGVVILSPHYSPEDFDKAEKSCAEALPETKDGPQVARSAAQR
jgi:hypothetical protein